jgi:putative ATPase
VVLTVVEGDLTAQRVDAVVNAANEMLQHGGGVAAAIVKAGGAEIQAESDRWVIRHGPLRLGQAAITGAGSMHAKWIVHVVGPRYREGKDNAGSLSRAVMAALDAAAEVGAVTIAMPAISAGIFGYPRPDACQVIVKACRQWDDANRGVLTEIRLVGYDQASAADFRAAMESG